MTKRNGRFVTKFAGTMLMVLSVPLAGTVVLAVVADRGTIFHEIVMIAIAVYAFTKITLATVNLVKSRHVCSAKAVTLRNISFATAFVSIFSLQRSMLVSFEGISDHAVNIIESAEEMRDKGVSFTEGAKAELDSLCKATAEIVTLSHTAFTDNNAEIANLVEPLEQVIDRMKELLRTRHIDRLRTGECGIEAGFVWSDLISNMERVSDHCSNIAGCVMDTKEQNMNLHESLKLIRSDSEFYREKYAEYSKKYLSFV